MITAKNIKHSFGDREILSGVNLTCEKGSISGLIGPSGGGKSVLLKIMAGIFTPSSGEIDLGGGTLGFMFQEGALFDSLSVADNVAFPIVNGRVPIGLLPKAERQEVWQKVTEILKAVGLSKAADKLPGALSGGMRRRAALARALVFKPDIAFLDDPTAGLDPIASSVIMELIKEMHQEMGSTMVLVSHDLRRLFPVVDQVHALFDGKIAFSGPRDQFLGNIPTELKHFISCRYDCNDTVKEVSL